MTDKKIIIDGVDVSGCRQYMPRHMEDYDIDTLDYCRYHFKPCKDVDVKYCYFKQLKRKEQECEELNKQVEILNKKLSRKRAVIKFADCPNYSYGDNTLEPTCTKNFCDDIKSCDHKDMVKCKQALDEIEDFLSGACNACKEFTPNRQSYIGCRYCQSTQILDIINKVKEEINEES